MGSLSIDIRVIYHVYQLFTISSSSFQSGLLYPLILVVSVPFTLVPALAGWDLYPLLIQFAVCAPFFPTPESNETEKISQGISPTLMIARVGLGDSRVVDTPSPLYDGTLSSGFAPESRRRTVISIVEFEAGRESMRTSSKVEARPPRSSEHKKTWVIRRK